jgi:hypothetical protein
MKPRVSKKADFIPARYSLITGDPRISPNNAFEVKAATSEDNKDGNKIKVVIISQAGAEGVDFKFLRQVHILQPWYNMSRIEQIIGRAVRNFSHKDLPFERRNVEIFMYGTILEKNKEEAADLYIYRVAEYKAVQIGKVTRLLKETAVDCIINHDQTNFTQDIMRSYEQGSVEQTLSNGKTIADFKVGDAPYSAACDYMENCEYKCYPAKEINEDNLNENSYNETFIMMNSEKIIQKIRALMRERFFYKKNDLILRINTPKPYPLVQIYSALTQVIENSNEYINDKYGRNGHLINIGEYYFFQPIELNNHNISVFDRTVPIDFKHSSVNFEIKPEAEIAKQVVDKRHLQEMEESRARVVNIEESALFKELKESFETAIHFARSGEKIPRGDENWYKHCGITMRKLIKEGIPENDVLMFLVEHIVDLLLYKEKVELLNYLYSLDIVDERSFEGLAKEYLDKKILKTGNITAIILYDMDKRKILKLDEKKNKWVDAEPEDVKDLSGAIKESFSIKTSDFNNLVGFIGNDDKKKFMVFKLKNMKEKRHTGARCDQKTKAKIIKTLLHKQKALTQ